MTFKTGESGNPTGRPKGTGYRQQLFNSLVEPHKEALFDTAIKLALSGNESMLRLFIERLIPAKPTDDFIYFDLPLMGNNKAHGLSIWGETIIQAISHSEMTPEQGRTIMGVLDAQRKNIETADLSTRIIEIERTLKHRKKEK